MTPTLFRKIYRALANPDKTPDDVLEYWFGIASNFLNGSQNAAGQRWDPISLDQGIGLYAAHWIVLDLRDAATVAAGGIPGEVKGPSTAKGTDKVSQSYDTKSVTFANEPFWNQTRYGVALLELAYKFGAGGIQVDGAGQEQSQCPNFGLYL
jgi:hypothetical protein